MNTNPGRRRRAGDSATVSPVLSRSPSPRRRSASTTKSRSRAAVPQSTGLQPGSLLSYVVLARPKFLYYSLACHLAGIMLARLQGRPLDWWTALLAQLTVWCVHLAAHFFNEYGDFFADRYNTNAGSWTGGSKILRAGLLPREVAYYMGIASLVLAFCGGTSVVLRTVQRDAGLSLHWPSSPSELTHQLAAIIMEIPVQYVLLGVSVMAVTMLYSLPPFRLSANALGEVCVAYVLTFALPLTGLYAQSGHTDFSVVAALLPACVINLNRMIVMNIPDRAGDLADNKLTSVVLVGEQQAVQLTNVITVLTYAALIPQLNLPRAIAVAYFLPLPLRWWQTLRLNIPGWWTQKTLVDSIPFVESMFVLVTVLSLDLGLWCESSASCRALLA